MWDAKEGASGEVLEGASKSVDWALLFETLPIIMSSLTLQWQRR